MVVIQADQGEWLSLVEASQRLGQSVQTLRRRIKEDKLPSRRATTSHGIAWQVWVATDVQDQPAGVGEDNHGYFEESNQEVSQQAIQEYATKGVLELISWLQRMQVENSQLSGRVGNLEAQLEQARSQLQASEEKVRMLEAPLVEPNQRPWWKNWWQKIVVG